MSSDSSDSSEASAVSGSAGKPSQTSKLLRFGIPAALSLVADQLSKQWARAALGPEGSGRAKSVIGKSLTFHYAENPGIAFSMFRDLRGGRFVLAGLAVVALVMVVRYLRSTDVSQRALHVALGLIAGGAIGNLVDRLIYARVVDFILIDVNVWPLNPWPVFNVADIVLVVGVGLIALDILLQRRAAAPIASPRSH
ncbi:MAG TPA: signal peptidase II [Polyangia bacterium]|jgi:signal peptidase II